MTNRKNILLRSLFIIMLLAISAEVVVAQVGDIQKAAKAGKKLNKYTKFISLNEFGKYTLRKDNRIIAYGSNFDEDIYKYLNHNNHNSPWHLVTDLVLADYDVNIYNGLPRNAASINNKIIAISGDNNKQNKEQKKERRKKDTYKIIKENPDINLVIKLNFDFDNTQQIPTFNDKFVTTLNTEINHLFRKIDVPGRWRGKQIVIIDFGIQTNKAIKYLEKFNTLNYAKILMLYANDYQLLTDIHRKKPNISLILNLSQEVKQNKLIEDIKPIQDLLVNNDTINKKTIIYASMLTSSTRENGISPMFPPHKLKDIKTVENIARQYQAFDSTGNQGFVIGPLSSFNITNNYDEFTPDGDALEDGDKMYEYNADFLLSNVLFGSNYTANRYGMVLYMLLFFFFTTPLAWVIAPNLPNYFLVRNRIYYDKNVFENVNGELSQNRKYRKKYLTVLGLLTFIWLLFAVILFTNWLKFEKININLSYHSGYFIWILLAFAVLNLVIPMLSASTKLVYKFYIKPIVNFIFFLKPKGLYQRIVKLQKIFTPSKKDKIYDAPHSKYSIPKKCMVSIVIFALLNVYGWQFEFPATTFSWIFYLIGFLIVAGFAYNIFHWRGKKLAVLLDDSYLETFPKDTQKYITTTYPQYGAKIKDEEEL